MNSPMNSQNIKVAILDNNSKFNHFLVAALRKEPDIRVVAEAKANLGGIKAVEERKPDVILMDNNMPFTDGLEDTKMVISRFPDTRIIILSMPSDKTMAATLCQAWACYHLCRKCSTTEILAAIREGLPLS